MTTEKTAFLPLGSICIVKGNTKKVMIIARGLATVIQQETVYFDYGACLYPEGMMGDSLLYFNKEDIAKVVHNGFEDEDNELMLDNLNMWVEQANLPKGDVYALNKQNQKTT
ncbi:DUF4176 domain-containing protein [Listeria booriae]|uniref:DUF4176 domain-containing protein n=1 Tax=Listeria booriae TaxID=1552123 RepID=UPI00162AA4BA|nr:DUF4176 domain-containing protein [Listeria booriae]MBC1973931.1 DUF4176 domain-containing protein [Listeria booriae]MBC1984058.1 DUF4176 domain-containing protein [Listeria booriae]MBC2031639.1 DUF4176 domain-containing protein [Listeria booriae]MBC2048125.1 DUF4176 domain-containing protein [Listeria booriae]